SGAWFSYGGERIGQGRENARDFLKLHPEMLADVESKLYEKFGVVRPSQPAGVPVELAKEEEKRPRVKAVKEPSPSMPAQRRGGNHLPRRSHAIGTRVIPKSGSRVVRMRSWPPDFSTRASRPSCPSGAASGCWRSSAR